MSYVRSVYGLGDAVSDYQACVAAKAGFDGAVKALAAWSAQQAANQAYYSQQIATLTKKYNVSYPSGAPRCITKAQKDDAAIRCYRSQNVIKGLGLTAAEAAAAAAQAAYLSSPLNLLNYPACFVAELPVCYATTPKPIVPANPGTCVPPPPPDVAAQAAATKAANDARASAPTAPVVVTPTVQTSSAPTPAAALFPDPEEEPEPVQAAMTGGSSRGGLLAIAAVVAIGGAWLLMRKKKQPAT
jgi:hypothetical protein